MVNIIQHGVDGFGHQLHGLVTCMALHGVRDYNFDGHAFRKKKFKFGHLSRLQKMHAAFYFKSLASRFVALHKQDKRKYTQAVHAHEREKIPATHDPNCLYSLDNCFRFPESEFTRSELLKIDQNIKDNANLLFTRWLPKNRLPPRCMVLHFRMGDALATSRGARLLSHFEKVKELLILWKEQYPDHHYVIHSDGDVSEYTELIGNNYTLFPRNTPILQVLSDFLYADYFVCSDSSLSKVAAIATQKKLCLYEDQNDMHIPAAHGIAISQYLSSER